MNFIQILEKHFFHIIEYKMRMLLSLFYGINKPLKVQKKILENICSSSELQEIIIFDIGINYGHSIREFRNLFRQCTIHGFEPNNECFSHIERKFKNDKKIILNKVAASDSSGIASFYTNNYSLLDSLLPLHQKSLKEVPSIKKSQTYEVKTITLDSYIEEKKITHIDILKVDTQGAELMTIKGLGNHLKKVKLIFVEVNFFESYENGCDYKDITDYLTNNGFKLYGIYGLYINKKGKAILADYLFINEKFDTS